jgi:hypothetical protein
VKSPQLKKDCMDRVALGAILLLVAGAVMHPLITGSGRSIPNPASAQTIPPSDPVVEPPATAPAATPEFRAVRGREGFWRVVQSLDGAWWFCSPAGRLEFMNNVTTVQPFQQARDPGGIHFVSRDWNGGIDGATGDIDTWAARTLVRVRDVGFKGLGAWSHPTFHRFNIPMTRDLNLWTWMKPESRRFYSPEWHTTAARAVETQVVPLRDNANLIGYFIDNELDWGDGNAGPARYFDYLAADDPNRLEVIKVIQSIWPTVEQFNADWEASLSDFKELESWQSLPHEKQQAYGRLFAAWLSHLAEDYFRTTTELIRRHDPNHLIMGVRFRGYAPREVVRASRDFTDAQSINYYVSDGRLDPDMFRMMYEESGQPIIVTEYSFHALDGRSGNRNTVGFAAQVLDQQARADGYRLYTSRMARVPFVIGCDWFQWSDEPPSGRSHDGEDVNFGIVDIDDHPYELLTTAVRETTSRLNELHAGSTSLDQSTDPWRESFAQKPSFHVPYIGDSIVVNGELSDWPLAAKLTGIRHSQTIGLERSSLPPPRVFLGWSDKGLYAGIEVFDNDIQGVPPKGWWWTRDHVEFWVATRPPPANQDGYDVHSHQFFFVPNDWPGEDGLLGLVGQWHRPGDAIKDHLIPHPKIKNVARVRPDRYVVEMFIPADALHDFDPANHPELAFNIHVRNFQHAIDYFWSAPKEVMTQLRPNTWGPLKLAPPAGSNIARTESAPAAGN